MDALFHDRSEAGRKLGSALLKYVGEPVVVLAIPRGGVPVACEVAKSLNAQAFDLLIARKIPLPWNQEAGFGAVTSTGEVVLNQEVLKQIHLSPEDIIELSEKVYKEIRRRMDIYRGDREFPEMTDKVVIIVDDGMATGFTMVAAIKSVKKYKPRKIVAAVPVAPASSVRHVQKYADEVVTLWSEETREFAVASFYTEFPDLEDEEVVQLLDDYDTLRGP